MSESSHILECTHCGVRMTEHQGSGGIEYFRCGSCHRWYSSMYSDVLRADAKMRRRELDEARAEAFESVKDRLERWLAAIDQQDPYHVLGVRPSDPPDRIRARYRELAFEQHPDRGGSTARMRELNDAYQRVVRARAARPKPEPAAASTPAGLRARAQITPA